MKKTNKNNKVVKLGKASVMTLGSYGNYVEWNYKGDPKPYYYSK